MMNRRFYSCATRFHPISESYKSLHHIHFKGITPFEVGEKVQNLLLNANLDFKKLEGTIRRKRKEAEVLGSVINEYEEKILAQIMRDKPSPTLLTFEFDDVYTGGKQMKKQSVERYEALCKYHQLERGGKVTWHGRGQLVAYPIVDLKHFTNLSVKCYIDSVLLKSVLNLLENKFQLKSYLNDNPGVWMAPNDLKIASVGCNIQRAVTSYGVAVNIQPDLKYMNTFEMCGLSKSATSVVKQKGEGTPEYDMEEIAGAYAKELANLLNIENIRSITGGEPQ